jgi:hypothetical protein
VLVDEARNEWLLASAEIVVLWYMRLRICLCIDPGVKILLVFLPLLLSLDGLG